MRLISQNGSMEIDMPYESTELLRRKNEIIAFSSIRTEDVEFPIAKYSTEEKAYKVMEMVRNDYLKIMRIENGSSIQGLYDIPKVFIFPKDEDVEV